jgi:uncharacterized protein (DUF433 family)
MEIFPGVTVDADVRFGRACIVGTRVDVATVVGALGAGDSLETVQEAFRLSREQLLAALRYAADLVARVPAGAGASLEAPVTRARSNPAVTPG